MSVKFVKIIFMKLLNLLLLLILFFDTHELEAQEVAGSSKKFKLFNRTEVNYSFGINEPFPNERLNVFKIKTTIGKQNEHFGAGIGLSTASYRSTKSGGGSNFNTISFTGNIHYLLYKFSDDRDNIFVKAGAGYSPRFFNSYDRGFIYDVAAGYVIKTRKGARYFISALYQRQEFDKFKLQVGNVEVKSLGLGIGTWF